MPSIHQTSISYDSSNEDKCHCLSAVKIHLAQPKIEVFLVCGAKVNRAIRRESWPFSWGRLGGAVIVLGSLAFGPVTIPVSGHLMDQVFGRRGHDPFSV